MHVKIQSSPNGEITIVLSGDEFGILQNALNEALENVAPSEVTSRLGATIEEVERLLRAFRNLEQ
jgi:hypothetical protein